MKLLWTAAPKLGSKLIQWGLKSDCSHFAVVFSESEVEGLKSGAAQGIVFHSYGKGTQMEWLESFLSRCEVVHACEWFDGLSEEREVAVFNDLLSAEANRQYDYTGFLWFTWRAILYRALAWRVAGVNRWQRDDARLCTGIAPTVLKSLGVKIDVPDIEMVPPHRLWELVMRTGKFVQRPDWAEAAPRG